MNCVPSRPGRISPLGITTTEQDYQHLYTSRVRRVCVSGAALLFAAFTHAVVVAAFIISINDPTAAFPVVARYAGAFIGVLPITYFLARIYTHSRADACQARAWLAEFRALDGRTQRPIDR